jgi:hypothetical protein
MRMEFGFLSYPGTYVADVPTSMRVVEYTTTVVVDQLRRSVRFSTGNAAEAAGSLGQVPSRAMPVKLGGATAYDQVGTDQADPLSAPAQSFSLAGDDAIPQTTFLYWQLPSGYLCTHVYPDLDRMSTVLALTQGLHPSEDSAGRPRLALGRQLRLGHLTEPVERDAVALYADDPNAAVVTVSFGFAGALAADGASQNGHLSTVTRATPLGITVTCDGTARDGSLRSRTAAIASSLEAA